MCRPVLARGALTLPHPGCRFNYDLNGNLHLLNPGNSARLTPLRYDLRDRITRLGDVQYRLDEDGFLRQRGAEIFEYNSKGGCVGEAVIWFLCT